MFEGALLDSSLRQTQVLVRMHWLISALAGALFFAAAVHALPLLVLVAGERALFFMAVALGGAASLFTLMLCYVWADARRERLNPWAWTAFVAIFSLPGFLVYLVYTAQKTGDWRRAAIPLAYLAEGLFVGVLILIPLVYTQALPNQLIITEVHIPPPPGPLPAPATPSRPVTPARRPAVNPFQAPVMIPNHITIINEPPEPPPPETAVGPYVPGVPQGFGSSNGWVPGGALWSTNTPPPPPPAQHTAPGPTMIHLGGNVVAAKALYQPQPAYPQIARMARIEGTVVLQAIIAKDGSIKDLKAMGGPALLITAAMDAVRNWRYQPTLLNTEPVEVETEIDVIFKLAE